MTSVEKPFFFVACRDEWVGNEGSPRHSLPAFGTREDAEDFARDCALSLGEPAALYRIVEYRFSGKVQEANP